MTFEPYPFEKLNQLLEGIKPDTSYKSAVLTIGEPQFNTPTFIQDALKDSTEFLKKYPKTAGEEELRQAQRDFVKKRFSICLDDTQIVPSFGTREVLFNFPQFLLAEVHEPIIAYTNPFYQIYEGAAKACKAKVFHINLQSEDDFKAQFDSRLKDANLVILNFPNNPTAGVMSIEELGDWVKLALKYDFVLLNDECYSEIYTDTKPVSLLEASVHVGNHDFTNVLVVNSISKRSSAPGLRSGFIAGDAKILTRYKQYRTYVGAASPLPLQIAAAKAWSDEEHVQKNRALYKENMLLAKDILGVDLSEATFYVWLHVEDDLEFTKKLYEKKNVKVLPGSYLGREGMGSAYVRIALVEHPHKTKEVLERIRDFMKGNS